MRSSRAFGLLSTFLLIAGSLVVLLPVASATGLRVNVGTVAISGATATVPLQLRNGGFLALNGLRITISLRAASGGEVGTGSSSAIDVPAGGTVPITVTVTGQGVARVAGATKVDVVASTNIGGLLPVTTTLALPISPTGGGGGQVPTAQTPIKHVVVIMMENHAFDNIFGVYPTDNATSPNPAVGQIEHPVNYLSGGPLPAGVSAIPAGTYTTNDLPHDRQNETAAWNNGLMDGFLSHMGPDSVRYYTSSQLAGEWNLAAQYGLGDYYFQPVLGPTIPNRLMALTGTAPDAAYSNSMTIESSAVASVALKSLFAELTQQNLDWGYYSQGGAGALSGLQGGQSPFPASNLGSVDDFFSQLSNGSMPSVTWLDPFSWTSETNGANIQFSQHPPNNVTQGEVWMMNIVNKIESSQYWSSSAIFITYDEAGGYYDQVAPPTIDGQQLGFRVPLIVVSPYAKEGYVSHTLLTHTSIAAFIDYNWKLPGLSQLVLDSNIPLDFFDFNGSARQPMTIDPSAQFPIAPQVPFQQLSYQRVGTSNTTLAKLGGFQLWRGLTG